jgi:hypothetical protein
MIRRALSRLHSRISPYLPEDWRQRELRQTWDFPLFADVQEKKPKKVSKRSPAFDPEAPTPLSNRPRDTSEEDWVATPWNGMIPVVAVAAVGWGLSEKWLRTLPCPNDGEFGPMRYANNPDAKHWGNYRKDIQPRKGRRHLDRGM